MHHLRIIIGWLISPRQLLGMAGLCAAAGLLWGYATVHENASRKLALRQGPPPPAAIEEFRAPVHRGPAGEVVLHARADLSAPLVLVLPRDGARALAVPLFPLAGGDAALGAILVPLAEGQEVSDAAALAIPVADGHVAVNGRQVDAGDFELVLAGALAVGGRSVGARFVAVEPYLDGREAALQPVADPGRMWLLPIGAAFALALAAFRGHVPGGATRRLRRTEASPSPRHPGAMPPAGTKAAQFAPLPRQEEVSGEETPSGPGALARAVGLLVIVLGGLSRAAAALGRTVRDGVVELRSPR